MVQKLLTRSASILNRHGFEQIGSSADRTGETEDITHTMFVRGDEEYHVRAKKYLYEGKASFGEEQVEHAVGKGATLVMYVDEERRFIAFDANYVQSEGESVNGQSKMSDERDWLEVDVSDGVELGAYTRGDAEPEDLSGGNSTFSSF
jgi:hypothetical protein